MKMISGFRNPPRREPSLCALTHPNANNAHAASSGGAHPWSEERLSQLGSETSNDRILVDPGKQNIF